MGIFKVNRIVFEFGIGKISFNFVIFFWVWFRIREKSVINLEFLIYDLFDWFC